MVILWFFFQVTTFTIKPAKFVSVFSEEKLEKSPALGDISEISVNIDILDKLNAAAASRRKD